MIPSIRLITFEGAPSIQASDARTRRSIVVRMTTGRSKNLVVFVSIIGAMIAVSQSMKNIFTILDPRTFPIAISVLPVKLAMTDTTNSGILVPIATMVSPMIASETLYFFASDTAPSTRKLAQ